MIANNNEIGKRLIMEYILLVNNIGK